MNEYNICYSLDNNYTEQLCASIASILVNSSRDCLFNFYILENGLISENKTKIELLRNIKNFNIKYIKMKDEDFKDCPMLAQINEQYREYHVTKPTYYRFLLPDILKNLDKVLYLDCDVIVKGDLTELFQQNSREKAGVMVLHAESNKEAKRLQLEKYYNAGVMLINLEYWRKYNVKDKLFDYAINNKNKILWQDQDIINAVLNGEIVEVSNIWNYQYFQYENVDNKMVADAKILHLAGRFKPWLMPFESEIYDEYYEYLRLTPFKNKITEYKLNASGKRLKNNIGGSVTNIVISATDKDIEEKCRKNYEYTNEKVEGCRAEVTKYTDEKANACFDEITKNYEYTNEKVEGCFAEITKNYEYTKTLNSSLNKDTDLKFSENYAYFNMHVSSLYKELKSGISTLENSINIKSYEQNNTIENINKTINAIKNEIETLPRFNNIDEIKRNIEKREFDNALVFNSLKAEFEDKLNFQRIKYERKIMDLEKNLQELQETVKELKKTPFEKFMEKFRKK